MMLWRWYFRKWRQERQVNRRLRVQLADTTAAGLKLAAALDRANSRAAAANRLCEWWIKDALAQKHRADDAQRFLTLLRTAGVDG